MRQPKSKRRKKEEKKAEKFIESLYSEIRECCDENEASS